MRKRIIRQENAARESRSEDKWLELENRVQIELSSEDPLFPIEAALTLGSEGQGWRAAGPGEQLVRITFDTPTTLHRIKLQFIESVTTRTQEFVLRWAPRGGEPLREIVRQQWTFSPNGSTSEIEDYQVNLTDVGAVELAIQPDISRGDARASLAMLRVA